LWSVGFLPGLLAARFRSRRKPSLLEAGDSASKLLKTAGTVDELPAAVRGFGQPNGPTVIRLGNAIRNMGVDPGTISVLCVDDDPDFVDVTARMLQLRNDAIETTAVTSATEGLAALAERPYDCVVSDYDMPETDGLEFLNAVRDRCPDLPFVLFTGKGSEEIASEAIRAGVSDYIQKGVGRERYDLLTRRVENAASRARARRGEAIARRRYEQLFEQSVVGIGASQDGVFVEANARFAELFGYTRQEVLEQSVNDLIAPEDRDRVARALRRREQGSVDALHYVVTGQRKDGERIELEVHGGRVTYEGEPAVLGVVVPVERTTTDRERLSTDRLHDLTAEIDAARAELDTLDDERTGDLRERLDDVWTTLSTVVSHRENDSDDRADDSDDRADDSDGRASDGVDAEEHGDDRDDNAGGDTARRAERRSADRLTAADSESSETTASLRRACRDARAAVADERGTEPTVRVETPGTFAVEQSVLSRTVQRLFEAGLGERPGEATVTARATPNGFSVHVESPTLESRLADGLVDGVGSQPAPVTSVAKRRYWAVYTTSVADDAVEYEVEGPNCLDWATTRDETE
jgi:PAS domain S-box-containing protein